MYVLCTYIYIKTSFKKWAFVCSKLQAGIELFKNCTIEIPTDDDENSVYEDED